MSRFGVFLAAACAALVVWLSQGTIAPTGIGGGRVGILPLSAFALLTSMAAGFAVVVAARFRASLAPCALLALLLLPWLPGPLPAVFFLWSGPLGAMVWIAAGVLIAASIPRPALRLPNPAIAAGLLALAIDGISAWQVSPAIPGGDEPHYLVITQSLLYDHDLKIENNHQRGDYRAYFPGDLPKPDYRRRGKNGEIYSIHAPGLSALVAPAFAIGGYPAVVAFLILLSAAGSGLAWELCRRVTGRTDAAWFGWAAVTFSASSIFHSFTVFPDGPGGVIALTGVWALLRLEDERESGSQALGPWWLHGAALAILPWLHSRFAIIAGSLGALVLLRLAVTRNAAGKAVAFLTIPAFSAMAWIGYFVAIYGRPDPSWPYGNEEMSAAFMPGGLGGLLFDQRFGLLAYAPALAFAFSGLIIMLRDRAHRRLALQLLFVLLPYVIVVTQFAMWWGGSAAPARFLVPMLLPLMIPASVAWTAIANRATRSTALAALAFTVFAAGCVVFPGDGSLGYNERTNTAHWLDWLNGAFDLAHALPLWIRDREWLLFRDAAVWCGALAAAWLLLRALAASRPQWPRATLGTVTAAAYAVAAMIAASIVLDLSRSTGINTAHAQIAALRRLAAESRPLAIELRELRRLRPENVPERLMIAPARNQDLGGAGPLDRPLYALPSVPAGRYRLQPHGAAADGWLMVGIGRDQFSLHTDQVGAPERAIVMTFPVDVRAVLVRGDEVSRQRLESLTIEPLAIVPAAERLTTDYARHGVRYGAASIFFLDDRSFPEPEAFWVGGGRRSTVVVQPDVASTPRASLLVRNGPVENRVVLEAGKWRDEIALQPGEERLVFVPLDARRGATLLAFTTSSGFQPSSHDPRSRDTRYLGVWVKPIEGAR